MASVVIPPSKDSIDQWLLHQRVCVTGGRGALGKRLVRGLEVRGVQKIVVLDNCPLNRFKSETVRQVGSVEHVDGSILEPADLHRALSDSTLVFHLAALTHVGRSQAEPMLFFEVNSLGTARVLEACRQLGIPRLVYTSTGHVYGVPLKLPITEEHPTVPISVYSASKLAGEVVVQGYAASYQIDCEIARLSNLYGASFGNDTVIGTALNQVISGKPILLRNLAAIRDFIHADDVVEALIRLAATVNDVTDCRPVNISINRGVSVREMAETLANIAVEEGFGQPEIVPNDESPNEPVPRLVLDNRRLQGLTGWTPQIELKQGLRLALRELQEQKR